MTDPNDNVTGGLPLEGTTTEAPKRKAAPRAKYTEAYIMRCTANREEDHPAVMLLTALVGTNTPHRAVDEALGIPDETTSRYMTSGVAVDTPNGQFNDDTALAVFEMLYRLKIEGAFGDKGLNITGVLKAMRAQ